MKRQQIITVKVTYDDHACSEECIAGSDCCMAGECEDIISPPVDDTDNNTLLWDLDQFGEHAIEILQASPDREV